ncbi:MAG: hypothetical protein GC180_06460 [Bacteroidetes bacterium]|nr:hypothetical protein [Bacteroidota bacterium]
MEKLAKAISIVFHPLLLITLGTWFILDFDSIYHVALGTKTQLIYLLIILMGTFILPLNAIFFMQRIMSTDISVYMQEKRDRRIPLLISAICVLLTFYLFNYKLGYRAPHIVRGYLLGTAASIVLASIVNLRFKISLHSIGLGGTLGLLIYLQENAFFDLRPIIACWILFSGIVIWARLYLHSHNLTEIYTGFLSGLTLIYLIVRL